MKYTESDSDHDKLKEAVDTMLQVLKYVNDAMNQLAVIGFKVFTSDLLLLYQIKLTNIFLRYSYEKYIVEGQLHIML